jgi:serine/threonine protein kinase
VIGRARLRPSAPRACYRRRVARLLAGRYELGARLGRGSMGEVWEAIDRETGEDVAVKTARPATLADPGLLARFEREGKLLRRLRTPYVCGFRAAARTDEGVPFLVVERLRGETLEALLAREGDLPLNETLRVGRELLSALVVAHDAGVVHRDLSPANVFLHEDPSAGVITKVLDFGVAKVSDPSSSLAGSATESGSTIGTLAYVAPEQLGGSTATGPRADLYAAGTVLVRALTGRLPFGDARGARLLALKREHDPPSVDDLTGERWPVGVRTFLAKLMARSPARRYPSASAALAALDALDARPAVEVAVPGARAAAPESRFEPTATQTVGPPRRRPR